MIRINCFLFSFEEPSANVLNCNGCRNGVASKKKKPIQPADFLRVLFKYNFGRQCVEKVKRREKAQLDLKMLLAISMQLDDQKKACLCLYSFLVFLPSDDIFLKDLSL